MKIIIFLHSMLIRYCLQFKYGLSNGTFSNANIYSVGYNARPQSVAIGDINNDDMLDIVVVNYGTDYVEILLQTC